MEVFKKGSKSYLVFPKETKKEECMKAAKAHFKTRNDNLVIVHGKAVGEEVVFPWKAKDANSWVVFKEKNH